MKLFEALVEKDQRRRRSADGDWVHDETDANPYHPGVVYPSNLVYASSRRLDVVQSIQVVFM